MKLTSTVSRKQLAGLMLFFFAAAFPAFAHHAWRGYDMANITTVKGTVTEFDWGNPHVWMNFDVKDENGNVQKWSAGGPSPIRMMNAGWDKNTFKPGDQATFIGNKITDGTLKLRLSRVILSNGKQLMCYGRDNGA